MYTHQNIGGQCTDCTHGKTRFGIWSYHWGNFTVDMKAVKARKDKIVNQSTTGVEKWLKGTKNLTVFEGHARFESANTISIGEELLKADQILLT